MKVEFYWNNEKEVFVFEFDDNTSENDKHNEIMLELMNWVYLKTNANYREIE